jgi:16S rRNA (guanine1207-N2)-methyltransferase
MTTSRLSLALADTGGLPEAGRVLVLRPPATANLSVLPRDRCLIVTGFRPDVDAFAAQGFAVAEKAEGRFAAALVFQPRARALARAMIQTAAAHVDLGGPIWVDGQKTDGIDTLYRDVAQRIPVQHSFAKAHGRAFCFTAPGEGPFADWQTQPLHPLSGFTTLPGVFSADGIDAGSALLAARLPAGLKGKGADLGAGWGWLAAKVLSRPGVSELHLVEAEADALACARENVQDDRARFHWADAARFRPERALDFVVTNPPHHPSRASDPSLGAAFLRQAARILAPSGQLWLVANRNLPYEEVLKGAFQIVTPVAAEGGFKILSAQRPLKSR